MDKTEGLIAAAFTPMDENGELNLEMIEPLYEYYSHNNVKGVFLNGSTGEGLSLTVEERKTVCEAWSSVIQNDLKLIVQVGCNSLKESRQLAEHAAASGVDGIATIGPFYRKPANVDLLVEFCREIAFVVPDLPFYYYHIPVLTGLRFPMIDFLRAAQVQIPNLAGLKFTDMDLSDFKLCHAFADEKYDMLFGNDEMFLSGLAAGAKGFIGSTYNLYPGLYHEIRSAFEAGEMDEARRLQTKAIRFVHIIDQYDYSSASKAVMQMLGIDCGPSRLPLKSVEANQITELEGELMRNDFFDYVVTTR